jgi:hypothetical protein
LHEGDLVITGVNGGSSNSSQSSGGGAFRRVF